MGATATSPASAVIGPKWKQVPMILIGAGGLLAFIGACVPSLRQQFAHSYLLGYMFFLSICLGGLFLTMLHHLFDASWSVATRRLTEHLAWLLPVMGVLFVPIAICSFLTVNGKDGQPTAVIYQWMHNDPHLDHALHAKQPVFTRAGFFAIAVGLFVSWWFLVKNLRDNSLQQDKTGAAIHTFKMRFHSGYGIFLFAVTLTLAVILWVKSLEHQWYSTMYGVYYFAESVWTTLATLWVLTALLARTGHLKDVVNKNTMHCIGLTWFAFTVFYAYIHFSQYFLQWNANIPEETFWYVKREQGTWWQICLIIVFGHFLFPFLVLLRIDAKVSTAVCVPLAIWAWLMHYVDTSFNIMPVIHPDGFVVHWLDLACLAFIGGVLVKIFIKYFNAHPPYPLKDPRLGESLGVHGQHPIYDTH